MFLDFGDENMKRKAEFRCLIVLSESSLKMWDKNNKPRTKPQLEQPSLMRP